MEKRKLEINPNEKQYEAWLALQNPDIAEIHYGGAAGGGKTWLGCESRITRAYAYPGYKSFIGRNELTRLMNTCFITFQKVCKFHNIPNSEWNLNGKYNYIEFKNGSRIDLLDLAHKPSDPMYERLGSLEYTDGWVDEAGEVPFMAIDILQRRIRRHRYEDFGVNPVILYTYNPKKGSVYRIYKAFKDKILPKDIVFIQALYSDNPYTADIYGKQLNRIKDTAMRARLKLGSFDYDDDPTSLINTDSAIDLFTNTVDYSDDKFMSIDVARHGIDKTVVYLWKGWTLYGVRIYEKQGVDITAQKTKDIASNERIPFSNSVADEDGVGGGVVDINRGFRGFINNSQPLENPETKEKENYINLKSQCSYKIAEMTNSHKIAIKIEPGQFVSEVEGVTYETWKDLLLEELGAIKSKITNADSKLRVRSKEDVKEEIGRSPDFSDTLMMRAIFEYPAKKINFGNVTINRPVWQGFNRK